MKNKNKTSLINSRSEMIKTLKHLILAQILIIVSINNPLIGQITLDEESVDSAEINETEPTKSRFLTSDDESVYVIQPRNFSKKGKLELTPMFFSKLNPRFSTFYGAGLGVGFHFSENVSLEVYSSLPFAYQSTLSDFVFEIENFKLPNGSGGLIDAPLQGERVDYKKINYFAGANLQFSALYGKFDFFKRPVDYDFYILSGFGFVDLLDPCVRNTTNGCGDTDNGFDFIEPLQDKRKLMGNLGAGFRLFFNDHLGLKLEVRDLVFSDRFVERPDDPSPDTAVTFDVKNNFTFFVGLSVLTSPLFGKNI